LLAGADRPSTPAHSCPAGSLKGHLAGRIAARNVYGSMNLLGAGTFEARAGPLAPMS